MDCYDYQEYYAGKDHIWEIKWLHFYGSTSQEYFDLIYEKYGAAINLCDNTCIQSVLDLILKIGDKSAFVPEARISMLITQMLTELLLTDPDSGEGYDITALNDHVQLALDYVEKNYRNNISLSELASHSCCSEYHFSRLFKKITGYSPHEYIVKYRVNKAKGLLKNTNKTVEEIAEGVGFGSTSNFIRTFRELEEMTPLKYRKYWN